MSNHEPEEVVFPPTIKMGGDPRGQDATWTMLPVDVSEGQCSQCAAVHQPDEPHNQLSLVYQYTFYAEHERWPTWLDAMAHCTEEMQDAWLAELAKRGVDCD